MVGTYTLRKSNKGFKSVKVQNIVASVGHDHDARRQIGSRRGHRDRSRWRPEPSWCRPRILALAGSGPSSLAGHAARNPQLERFHRLAGGAEPAASCAGHGPWPGRQRHAHPAAATSWWKVSTTTIRVWAAAELCSDTGGADTTISPDAIEEYRVIDGTPPAEYGKAGGFVTDTVLKSGTNQWHGSLFEYNRIQASGGEQLFLELGRTERSPHPQPVWRFGRRPGHQGQDVLLFHD